MSADLYARPRREPARNRRRILMLLCAFTVASYLWTQARFPLQRVLASSSIGHQDRENLILDTIDQLGVLPIGETGSWRQIQWAARPRSGDPLLGVAAPVSHYQPPWRQVILDGGFRPVCEITTTGSISPAIDRDNDGCAEFVVCAQDESRGMGPFFRTNWMVVRISGGKLELAGLIRIDTAPHAKTSGTQFSWRSAESDGLSAADIRFRQIGVGPAGNTTVTDPNFAAALRWSRSGGVLRLSEPATHLLDCMPSDEPVVLPADGRIDSAVERLISEARARRRESKPGSESQPDHVSP